MYGEYEGDCTCTFFGMVIFQIGIDLVKQSLDIATVIKTPSPYISFLLCMFSFKYFKFIASPLLIFDHTLYVCVCVCIYIYIYIYIYMY